jgi:hypothetical protein
MALSRSQLQSTTPFAHVTATLRVKARALTSPNASTVLWTACWQAVLVLASLLPCWMARCAVEELADDNAPRVRQWGF